MSPGWKRQATSVAELRRMARRVLPRPVFDFADGGAEDEATLRRNETAFQGWDLVPRPLDGAAERDLSVTLLGHRLSLPVLIGPTGLSGLFAPDGERSAARAAARAGTGFCLSHASVCTLEQLADVGAAPRWMQVFIYRDRGFTEELARRAQVAGYDGLVLTVDNQLQGNRERDQRNGFTIPPRFAPLDLVRMVPKAPWLWRMRTALPQVNFANYLKPGETLGPSVVAARLGAMLDPGMTWADVTWLRGIWRGPLILKGILSPAEAVRAIDEGVDAVIVSNHGGRQLDGAMPSIEALPAVAEAVAGRMPLLADGGIRRGGDVVKALALGASACLIARPQLWGLAVAGEDGVSHVLELFRREIDRSLGLMGVSRISDLSPAHVVRRGSP